MDAHNEIDENDLATKIANMSRSELQLLVNSILADPDMRSKVLEHFPAQVKITSDRKVPRKKVFDINKYVTQLFDLYLYDLTNQLQI